MSSTRKTAKPNALADKIAGFNDPSMGDERERDIVLRAYTFGAVLSIYTFFFLGLLFAVIGAGLWTVPIVLGAGVVGAAASTYCRREGVNSSLSMAHVAPRRIIASQLIGAAFTIAWVVAIVYHQTTGHPLIEAGLGSMLGSPDTGSSIIMGAAIGMITAIVILVMSRFRKLKQARLESERVAEIEDED